MNLKFDFIPGAWALAPQNNNLLKEIADFYSIHYGTWSNKQSINNKSKKINITLSAQRIREWFASDCTELWTVRNDTTLVGYAIALKGKSGSNENIIWVTQFVVHKDYRNIGIGEQLLLSIWGFSSLFAWGVVTANPYAVRALEKITRRRCEPERIKRSSLQLFRFGCEHVSYIDESTELKVDSTTSMINTKFFVDHSDNEKRLQNVTTKKKPWILGGLEEGWEWFAFTFNDQVPFELTEAEITTMLQTSDTIVRQAYERMPMDAASQKWTAYTKDEVDYIVETCNVDTGKKVLDVGCGMGRHTIELSKRGYSVTGIDYSSALINRAKENAEKEKCNPDFLCVDIVKNIGPLNKNSFDLLLCLYDVIGSYADNCKNIDMMRNMVSLLKKGGYVVLSVMNYHLTEHKAQRFFSLKESSQELLKLPASNTMEKTGNVFNPEYYLIDKDTRIVYRKEIFSYKKNRPDWLPRELIVRDRRYYESEIKSMCEQVGLDIIECRFVNAGWKTSYSRTDDHAKEILLVCKKKDNH